MGDTIYDLFISITVSVQCYALLYSTSEARKDAVKGYCILADNLFYMFCVTVTSQLTVALNLPLGQGRLQLTVQRAIGIGQEALRLISEQSYE